MIDLRVSAAVDRDGVATVSVSGEVDLHSAPLLWEAIEDLIETTDELVVDLGRVPFADSSLVVVLERALNRCRRTRLRLVNMRPVVQRVLEATELLPLLEVPAELATGTPTA